MTESFDKDVRLEPPLRGSQRLNRTHAHVMGFITGRDQKEKRKNSRHAWLEKSILVKRKARPSEQNIEGRGR